MGVFHTKSILECDFWWPGLSTFVKHFIAGCAVCQQNKVNTHPTVPPLCPISSSVSLPFKQLSVDLITNHPLSSGFDSVMVVVNHGLTKGVILAPCSKTVDASGIAQLFLTLSSNSLDYMIPLSLTKALSSLLPLPRNLLVSSSMMFTFPLLIILRLMVKLSEPIRNLKCTVTPKTLSMFASNTVCEV